jgi:hypothetical protein
MASNRELEQQLRNLRAAGVLDIGMCCVVPDGVFCADEHFARAFAKRHDKELIRIEGEVPGWLAKNRPRPKV